MLKMTKAFECHSFRGVKFLVFPHICYDDSVHVVDENGNNYGSWVEWASFKRHFVRKLASRIDTVKLFLRH